MKISIVFFLISFLTYSQSSLIKGDIEYSYKSGKGEEGLIRNNNRIGAWKKYKNNTLSKIEYYYNNEVKFVLDKNDFILVESNKLINKKFKIRLPKYWKYFENKGNVLFSMKKKIIEKDKFQPTFSISILKLDSLYNFTENIKRISGYFTEKKKDFKLIQNRFIESKINDYKSAKLVFSFKDKGKSYGTILLMFKEENDLIVLTGTSLLSDNEFIKYKCVFEEIFTTFQVDNKYLFDKLNVFY